ncbi:MAG: DUF4238 domain-containing protein [Bdellovibrionota bacterium]|nr:DUF4238 domain-containing protein [Bdellovibrionota bacterium]
MEITKKQHYVFQSYLKGFSIDKEESNKMVWVYDKEVSKSTAPKFPKSVASICHSVFYYGQSPEGDDIYEKKFQELESKVAPVIKNLDLNTEDYIKITGESKGLLALMIGLSMTRVPSFRDGIEDLHKKSVETILHNNYLNLKGPNGEDFSEFMDKYKIGVEIEKWVSLEPMIKVAQMIGESILSKTWMFLKSPDGINFITSDNPVSYSYPSEVFGENPYVGPAHPLCEIIFPLKKNLVLVCTPLSSELNMRVLKSNSQEVKRINRKTALSARKYIVSDIQSDALARMVKKLKGTEQAIRC